MNPVLISKEYILVIDTNSFSDSFAKDLCAYCTGFADEKENGINYANLFYRDQFIEDDESPKGKVAEEKNIFYGIMGNKLDEDGIYSPCSIWLNDKYGYNADGECALLNEENYDEFNFPAPLSVGLFFDDIPDENQIQLIKSRAFKFFEEVYPKINQDKQVKVEGFRLITHTKYGEVVNL